MRPDVPSGPWSGAAVPASPHQRPGPSRWGRRFDQRWLAATACAATVLLAVLVHLPSLRQPIDRDMAAHATIGALANEGLLPYRDVVDNKQPLPYLVYAVADIVAPRSTLALRAAATATAAAAGVSILLLTRRRLGLPRATVAAALAVLIGGSRWVQGVDLNTEHLLVLTGLWAVLLPLRWPSHQLTPLVAGVLLGLAALTKAPGALLVLPAAILLFEQQRRRPQGLFATAALYGTGVLAPLAAVVAFYAARSAFDDLIYWNVTYNLGYVDAAPRGTGSLLAVNLELWPVLVLTMAGLAGAALALRSPGQRGLPAAVIAWVVSAYVGAKLGGREFPHYYAPLVVPAALGVALGLPEVRLARWPSLATSASAAVVLALAAPAVHDVASQYGQPPDALAIRLYRATQAVPWTHQDEAGAWLHEHAAPSDALFVVGNEPGFYWASGIAPATPYLFDLHVVVRPDFWDELARRLAADPPRWLVFPRGEPVWHPYVQPLQQLGYEQVAQFGPVHVLELPRRRVRTGNRV